jgi:hypothetical protein
MLRIDGYTEGATVIQLFLQQVQIMIQQQTQYSQLKVFARVSIAQSVIVFTLVQAVVRQST